MCPSLREPLGVGGMGEHRGREMRAPDRLAGGAARGERRVVERVAAARSSAGHPLGAQLAVRARAAQPLEQQPIVVVDAVAEDVQVLVAGVDRRDLGRRQQRRSRARRRPRERLVDAVDGVVVAEREQLDAGRGGRGDEIAGTSSSPSEWRECDCRSMRALRATSSRSRC